MLAIFRSAFIYIHIFRNRIIAFLCGELSSSPWERRRPVRYSLTGTMLSPMWSYFCLQIQMQSCKKDSSGCLARKGNISIRTVKPCWNPNKRKNNWDIRWMMIQPGDGFRFCSREIKVSVNLIMMMMKWIVLHSHMKRFILVPKRRWHLTKAIFYTGLQESFKQLSGCNNMQFDNPT